MRRFQSAQEAFQQAKTAEQFLASAAMFQEVLDSGFVSGAVLYNQGNAFMRAGQRGRAIAAYRQAQRYRPRDPYLEANLNYALGTPATAGTEKSIAQYIFFWQDWLSYPEKFQLTFFLASVTVALGILALFVRQRRLCRRLAMGSLILTCIAAASAGYDWLHYGRTIHGVTVVEEVTARKGNAASYEPAFTEPLPEGTELVVLETRGDWLLIRLAPGQEGWVEKENVAVY